MCWCWSPCRKARLLEPTHERGESVAAVEVACGVDVSKQQEMAQSQCGCAAAHGVHAAPHATSKYSFATRLAFFQTSRNQSRPNKFEFCSWLLPPSASASLFCSAHTLGSAHTLETRIVEGERHCHEIDSYSEHTTTSTCVSSSGSRWADLGVQQALAVTVGLAVDVLGAPKAARGDSGGLLCRHDGVATLECFLSGESGGRSGRSEVLDQRLRRLGEEREESAHERECKNRDAAKDGGKE
ncbi:hypothetical protein L1887_57033 [Cichorium endivia]|nr:hypothetical protein L1887_57033 [Cichorium endivia]